MSRQSRNAPRANRQYHANVIAGKVVVVPQVDGPPGHATEADVVAAADQAAQIAHDDGGFCVDQFNAAAGVLARETTKITKFM